MKNFLPVDKQVLDFIIRYKIQNCGDSPTYREIIENTSVKSTSHVGTILWKLNGFKKIKINSFNRNHIMIPGMRIFYEEE